ncbi:hypothetical protein MCETRH34_01259 [Candidatus Methylopumilus universalis]
MTHNSLNLLNEAFIHWKVRELSHQAIDEVLKTIGEIYEQEY